MVSICRVRKREAVSEIEILSWLRANEAARLVTTLPVMTEVCALLSRRIGNPAALDFLRWVERGGAIR